MNHTTNPTFRSCQRGRLFQHGDLWRFTAEKTVTVTPEGYLDLLGRCMRALPAYWEACGGVRS